MKTVASKRMTLLIFICMEVLLLTGEIQAQTSYRIDTSRTKLTIPRPALEPLKPLAVPPTEPIDTLDTDNEFIKVLIYPDNTWRYYKSQSYKKDEDIFNEYWDETSSNPYSLNLSELPQSWTIWLVDSLDQYCCPYQGDIHYRGKFGIRRGRRHQGVDIPLKSGEPIYATFNGKVRLSRYFGGFGNLIVIRHDNGLETFYAHLSKRLVEVGEYVNAGEVIGLGGSTGRSTGPHLHFETRYKGFAFDPQWLIDFKTGILRHRLFVLKQKYFSIYSNYEQDFEDEMKNHKEDQAEDAEKAAMRWHTIKSGDTLSKIARNNSTTVNTLCRLNGITPNTTLKIGKKIRVR